MPDDSTAHTDDDGDPRTALLSIVDILAREIHGATGPAATLDSALDRELGLDSLARAEILLRIEHRFGVRLPEGTLATAETPRDLLGALKLACRASAAETVSIQELDAAATVHRPTAADTLVGVLEWHASVHPERTHILHYRTAESTEALTYGALLAAAHRVARGLRRHGLAPGKAVAIMLPTGLDFFAAYFGTLMAGGMPAPLYPPLAASRLAEELGRQTGILNNCQAQILITVAEAKLFARLLRTGIDSLQGVLTVAELAADAPASPLPAAAAADIALLQYTSGSTGNPKGVVLSHANLLANIRAWSLAIGLTPADVCVSWLPLYHDMGLIGAWLGSLYNACPLVLMAPTAFLERPERWLWAIHRHRGTISAAPNFAYELCLRRLGQIDLAGLDLSSWRMAANGAEPVSPATVERFSTAFAPFGFRRTAMTPMYGLAECSVGLAVSSPATEPVIDRIRRDAFTREGRAEVAADDEEALRFVACGRALPGHVLRVVDDGDRPLPERRVGRLQFRGPSATSGYFRNPQENRRLFHGDWLETGDLAYLAGGQLYPTSRIKDMIIRAGRNLYPYEAEEAIGRLPGVRKGCVAVFGAPDPAAGTERLVAVVETRETDAERCATLRQQAGEAAQSVLETPLDDVVLAPPHAVQKTTSGKIRRAATRDLYLSGRLDAASAAPWRQVVQALAIRLGQEVRHWVRKAPGALYTLYALALLLPFYAFVWLAVVVVRRPDRGWRLSGRLAAIYLRLIGIRLSVDGLDKLPSDACIAVANHASYVDGLVVMAAVTRPFSFVAKKELAAQFLAGNYLRAIATEFVDRFDAERSVQDARHLARVAQAGRSLFVFPEGTFTSAAGLRPFHLGAFLAAAEAGLPVLPVAISGTRHILGDGSWRLRPGTVALHVGEPLRPEGQGWVAAVRLQQAARADILHYCGEPDCPVN